jgi:hypothetical protein
MSVLASREACYHTLVKIILMRYRTVLIGEQPTIMRKIAQGMMWVGISTRIAGSVQSLLNDFPPDQVDAIIIGRYLSQKKSKVIEGAWQARKPSVHIIYIKAPIGELIGETIQAHLFKLSGQEPVMSIVSLQHKRAINFTTRTTSTIDVVLYRYSLSLRRKMYRIYHEDNALSGRQIVQIPRAIIGFGGERFAVITINGVERHVLTIR